jgi:serine phosphatase RsbU (regulator of sigma subunit)
VIDNLHIDQQQFFIPEGGLALLFSDGLHEVFNSQGNIFGLDRIKSELLVHRQESAQTICNKLWLAVQNHSGEIPHQDDFTTVVIKRG